MACLNFSGKKINLERINFVRNNKLYAFLLLSYAFIFLTGCNDTNSNENKSDWFYGKWQPSSEQEKNFTALVFSLARVGYEIKKDTITGYVSLDFVSDPKVLAMRVMKEEDATKEKLRGLFYSVSKASYRVKSVNDTVCEIELLSGNELKFGYEGWGFPSPVVPGTLLKLKKSGDNITFERNLKPLKSYPNLSNDEVIRKQVELMLLLGNADSGGIYKLHLHPVDFGIDNNYKFTEEDKKGLHLN